MTPTLSDIFTPLSTIAACTQEEFTGFNKTINSIDETLFETWSAVTDLKKAGIKSINEKQDNIVKAITASAVVSSQSIASSSTATEGISSFMHLYATTMDKVLMPEIATAVDYLKEIKKALVSKVKTPSASAAAASPNTPPPVPTKPSKNAPFADLAAGAGNIVTIVSTIKDISLKDLALLKIKMPILKSVMTSFNEIVKDIDVKNIKKEDFEVLTSTSKSILAFTKDMALAGVLALPALVGAAGFWLVSKITVAGFSNFDGRKLKEDRLEKVKKIGKLVMVFSAEMALAGVLAAPALVGAAGFLLTGLLVSSGIRLINVVLGKTKDFKNIESMGLAVLTFMASMVIASVLAPVAAIGVAISSELIMSSATVLGKVGGKRMSKNIRNGVINIALMSLGFLVFSASFMLSATMVRDFFRGGKAGENIASMLTSVALFGLMLGASYLFKIMGKGAKNIALGAVASAAMGLGLVVFGFGLKVSMSSIKGVEWGDMFKLPALLGTFGVEFGLIGIPVVAGCIALGSAAVIGMSASLAIFGLSLKGAVAFVQDTDDEDRNWLVKSIGMFGAEFSLLGLASIAIGAGGLAVGIISASLVSLGGAMKIFQLFGITSETTDTVVDILKRVPAALSESDLGLKVAGKAALLAPIGLELGVFSHGVRIAAENIKKIGDLGDFGELGKLNTDTWVVSGGTGPLLGLQRVFAGLYGVFSTIGNYMINQRVSNFLSNPLQAITGAVSGGNNPIVVALRSFSDVGRVVKSTALAFQEVIKLAEKDLGKAGRVDENTWTVDGGEGAIGAVQNMFAGLYGVFGQIGDILAKELGEGGVKTSGNALFRMFESPKSSLQIGISSFSGLGNILEKTTASFAEVAKFNLKKIGKAGTVDSSTWTVSNGEGAIGTVQNMFAGLYGVFGQIGDILFKELRVGPDGSGGGVYTGPGAFRIFESPKSSLEVGISSFSGVGNIIKETTEAFKTASEISSKKLGSVTISKGADSITATGDGALYNVASMMISLFSMFSQFGIVLKGCSIEKRGFLGIETGSTNPLELGIKSFEGVGDIVKDTVDAFKVASEISTETMGVVNISKKGLTMSVSGNGALYNVASMMTSLFMLFTSFGEVLKGCSIEKRGFLGIKTGSTNSLEIGIKSFEGIGDIVKDSVNAFKIASEMSAEVLGKVPEIKVDSVNKKITVEGGSGALATVAHVVAGPFNILSAVGSLLVDEKAREEFLDNMDVLGDLAKSAKKSADVQKNIVNMGLTEDTISSSLSAMKLFQTETFNMMKSMADMDSKTLLQSKKVFNTGTKMFEELQKLDTGVKGTFASLAGDFNKGIKTLTNSKGIEKVTAFVNAMIKAKNNKVWDNLSKNMKDLNESINGLSYEIIDPLSKLVVALQEMSSDTKNSTQVLEKMKEAAEKLKDALQMPSQSGGQSGGNESDTKANSAAVVKSNPNPKPQKEVQQRTAKLDTSSFDNAVANFAAAVNNFVSKTSN